MKIPKWLKVLGISLGLFGLVSIALLWGVAHFLLDGGPSARCEGHDRFIASVWRDSAATYGPLAVRGCMVDDFLATHSLRGVSRDTVVAWLGQPRPTTYFSNYDLVYWLGPERSAVGVDSEWLVFRFDTDGRVTEFRLVTD